MGAQRWVDGRKEGTACGVSLLSMSLSTVNSRRREAVEILEERRGCEITDRHTRREVRLAATGIRTPREAGGREVIAPGQGDSSLLWLDRRRCPRAVS